MTEVRDPTPKLLDLIKSRGYWRVEIRPTRFMSDRIERITELYPLVEKLSVRFRGWDYPHVDSRNPPHTDRDWVGQEFAWAHYKEIWRLYQSGKFIHIFALPEDWRDKSDVWPAPHGWKPGKTLHALSALQTYTEIYEFAARLSLAIPGDDDFHVAITQENLKRRSLWDDAGNLLFFAHEYTGEFKSFDWVQDVDRAELVARPRELAAQVAQKLLARFGWEVSVELLRRQQLERP